MFQIVDAKCMDDNMEELADAVDVIFTATPQGLCGSLVNEEILKKVKIIDLSADFRIKMFATYEKWYGIKHQSPQFIEDTDIPVVYSAVTDPVSAGFDGEEGITGTSDALNISNGKRRIGRSKINNNRC